MIQRLTRIIHRVADRFVLSRMKPHALTVLTRRYEAAAAHQTFWQTEEVFRALVRRIPRHYGFGAHLIVSFATASAALQAALVGQGEHEAQATRIAAEVGRLTFAPLWRIPWRLGRLLTGDTIGRLAMTVRLFRLFPFRGPAYDMRQLSFSDGRVSLDVRICPVVALYEDFGIPHLCRALVCDLDFALAPEWEARLVRRQTLADGDCECDFRWQTVAPQYGGSSASPIY